MPALREYLKDHPVQSILTALGSIATIVGFIIVVLNKSSGEKQPTDEQSRELQQQRYAYKPGYYIVNGSDRNKVYFHNSPDIATRRKAFINTKETVYVAKIENGFGYIEFESTSGAKSYGWIELTSLISKP